MVDVVRTNSPGTMIVLSYGSGPNGVRLDPNRTEPTLGRGEIGIIGGGIALSGEESDEEALRSASAIALCFSQRLGSW